VGGLGALFWIRWFRNAFPLLVLMAVPPVYMYQRASGNWDGEWLKATAAAVFGEERGHSLATRIDAENKLTEKALRPAPPDPPCDTWFGRGKWDPLDPGRAPWRIYDEYYKKDANGVDMLVRRDMAPTDGLWVITLGTYGLIGLISLTVTVLLPALLLWRKVPLRFWDHPMAAAAAAASVMLVLHMSDNLLNAMVNPIFILALGGISGIGPSIRKAWQAQARGFAPVYPPGYAAAAPAGPAAYGQAAYGQAAYAQPAYAQGGYGPRYAATRPAGTKPVVPANPAAGASAEPGQVPWR
jgi:hypothetical protein